MPELPEVETVRAGLEIIAAKQPRIIKVTLNRADIRFPIPRELPKRLLNQPITGIRRRAKYLLIDTPKVILLSHLGMTGSWRILQDSERKGARDPHDHVFIDLSDGRRLAFRDPRRFGIIDLVEIGEEQTHPRLKHLGPEPLDMSQFTVDYLFAATRKRQVAIKGFIMDQKIVVGVGNIYASEALFRAGIRPNRLASRLKRQELERLVPVIQEILHAAIQAGGSSIRDFKQASGESGYFQTSHQVYDREGEPCVICRKPIQSKVIAGRSTYWCSNCQK
jgi:formamidopyrimidine-DNA glycosylase